MKTLKRRLAPALTKNSVKRAARYVGPLALGVVCASPIFAAGDPVSGFFTGIETALLAASTPLAVSGIVVAGAMYMFGSGRMSEIIMQVGIGALLLGLAGNLATWLFGL